MSSPIELKNTCFMGTSVQSGAATAVVVTTGVHTYLGSMARSITEDRTSTSFDQGLNRFTWLMIRLMAVMVPLSSSSTGSQSTIGKAPFFFAMALAGGLTPEMLLMIVSVCLSKGALAMSRKKVIVKRLNAIQNSSDIILRKMTVPSKRRFDEEHINCLFSEERSRVQRWKTGFGPRKKSWRLRGGGQMTNFLREVGRGVKGCCPAPLNSAQNVE